MALNKKIINKINDGDFDDAVKELLKKVLFKEMEHFGEKRWWHNRDYTTLINRLYEKYEAVES